VTGPNAEAEADGAEVASEAADITASSAFAVAGLLSCFMLVERVSKRALTFADLDLVLGCRWAKPVFDAKGI